VEGLQLFEETQRDVKRQAQRLPLPNMTSVSEELCEAGWTFSQDEEEAIFKHSLSQKEAGSRPRLDGTAALDAVLEHLTLGVEFIVVDVRLGPINVIIVWRVKCGVGVQ